MKFTEEELSKFQTLEELEKEIFTKDQIADIHKRALERSEARRLLSENVSSSIARYMAENKIGFNELKRRLGMSATTVSKIIRGDANLTLDTLALISQSTGMTITIHCETRRYNKKSVA